MNMGKAIINLQLSLLLYIIVSVPAILLLGLGILGLISVAILGFVLPIVNAIKAANGEAPSYFMTIPLYKRKAGIWIPAFAILGWY